MKQNLKKLFVSCLLFVFSFCLIPQNADRAMAAKKKTPTASFTSYYVGAPNQGFRPGKGKKLTIKTKYRLKKNNFKGTCRVRLRILNGEGKYVYQKLWTIKKSGSKTVKWNGKASEGNKAGVKAGSYVEKGFYKAEVAVRYQAKGTDSWKSAVKLARTFIIAETEANGSNSDENGTGNTGGTSGSTGTENTGGTSGSTGTENTGGTSGSTGTGNAGGTSGSTGTENTGGTSGSTDTGNTGSASGGEVNSGSGIFTGVPVYTGNKYIDYVAELMIQEAGVTMDMTEEEKVKNIYHYMTTHFHHVHYNKSNSYKVYYKTTTALKDEITAYGKEMAKRKKAGEIKYKSVGSGILWNMKRRIGECNHHALIFQILCRHVGIEAYTCKGYYVNMDGSRANHYWNSAVVDGETYYYDVDVEIQNYGNGQGDYYWYKDTYKKTLKRHEFTSFDVY